MTYDCFDVCIEGGIAHVVLKRGDVLNTMTPAFWRELPAILRAIDDEASARVVVLSSTGKHFSAGMDLSVFAGGMGIDRDAEVGRQRESVRRLVLALQDSFNAIERIRMPVLAAVQGGCIGGAVDMICAADVRYCTEDAYFCIQETNLGMTADVGTLQRLPHLIPSGWVRELAYTGRKLPARKAEALGLVNEVYPTQEAMLAAVMETAREIASKSPLTVTGCKEALIYSRDHSVPDSLNYIAA
ncbi:MAG: crotonase/enoyl-CoA hydratase family protein, partial [Polyangiaceae bacterium]|nr:crotonase/enoyl-CoA hydratase family protein [Polyangiaceae bacterium]